MLYIPVYVLTFFAVERLVPTTGYWVSYIPWDDLIPFCEYFVVFYCMWYPLLIGAALYLFLRDDRSFRLYAWFLIVAFTGTLLFCLLFPNGQDLRPAVMAHYNAATWLVEYTYSIDTNTNVFPSVHVVGAIGAAWAVRKTPSLRHRPAIRRAVAVLAALICLSTLFIKQHAVLDAASGLGLALAVGVPLYSSRRLHHFRPAIERE